MNSFFRKKGYLFSELFFVLFLIIGLLIYDDYGVSVDELMERNTGLITIKYVLKEKLKLESLPDAIFEAADLLTYEDKDYGIVLQLPPLLIEYMNNFRLDIITVLKIRHIWAFINFYCACIFFYLLINKRFHNWLFSLIGVLFLILSPRIFADSFYNIKDLMFLSWFIISLFFYVQFIDSPTLWRSFILSVVISLSSNIRVIGLIILLFSFLFLITKLILYEINLSQFCLNFLLLSCLTSFLWVLFLPASWNNPISFFYDTFVHFSRNPMFEFELYLGKIVSSGALPWHYLIIWIGITTPILYLVFFLGGMLFVVKEKKENFKKNVFFIDASIFLMFLLPIISTIILHSSIYDGWRHLYFIYGPFIYVAIVGFQYLFRSQRLFVKKIIIAMTIISLINTSIWMIRNHPYQMVYFNNLARPYASENFEKDYWRLSSKECLSFIASHDNNLRIDIADYDALLHLSLSGLPKQDRSRILLATYGFGNEAAKYLIANYKNIKGNELNFPFYTPIHHVKVDDMKIASVYQRDHQHDLWAQEVVEKINSNINSRLTANVFDGDLNSNWMTGKLQNSSDYLDIEFKYPLLLDGLTTYIGENENERPWSLQVFSSEDGINWEPVEIVKQNFIDYETKEVKTKFLRIKNSEPSEKYTWSVYELLFHGKICNDECVGLFMTN